MQATPMRYLNAALWPLTVWPSLLRFEDHAADDYVERTFPIVATAVAFWVCIGLLVFTLMQGGMLNVSLANELGVASRYTPGWVSSVSGVLWFFLPAIYVIGLWLYAARSEHYSR